MEKKKLIIIIVASVLALAVLIGGAVLLSKNFFKGNTDTNSDTQVSSTVESDNGGADYVISGSIKISAGSAEGTKGDFVSIPVNCAENPGINYSMGGIKYDATKLKFVSFEKGEVFNDINYNNKDGLIAMDLNSENFDKDVTDNGLLCTIKFEIISDEKGDTPVEIIFNDGFSCNSKEEIVTVKAENGKVTIK